MLSMPHKYYQNTHNKKLWKKQAGVFKNKCKKGGKKVGVNNLYIKINL